MEANPKYSAMNLGTGSFPDDENQIGDWSELGYTIRIQKNLADKLSEVLKTMKLVDLVLTFLGVINPLI